MLRLNQAAFDLLHRELRRRSRSTYAQVAFSDALRSLDQAATAPASPAEAADIANQLIFHRLQRLHDSQGNPVTYRELRQLVVDLIPNFPDKLLRQAAKLNRPTLTEMPPAVWPSLPLLQWSNLVLGAMVGGAGVMVLPLFQAYIPALNQDGRLPKFSTPAIAEADLPRSGELIPTAKTFAKIVQQRMQTQQLSVQEWQSVVNQWQESIDLLQQVLPNDRDYIQAQTLIATYKKQQILAEQQLVRERQAREAVKAATGRANWLIKRWPGMSSQQKASAIQEIRSLLQPVGEDSLEYLAAQQLLARMQQLK